MQVRNRLFPYPVLNHNPAYSNYPGKDFSLIYEEEETDNEYILKNLHFETNSEYIQKLMEEGKIGVVCVVECSYTVFRKRYFVNNVFGDDLILNKKDFAERVNISMFAYAKENINMNSTEFDSDYGELSFAIDKNNILAANDGYYVYFKHESDDDNLAQSIFNVNADHNLKDELYRIEFEYKNRINIWLTDEGYKNYKMIYTFPSYKEVFFSILLVPALGESLSRCIEILRANQEKDLDDLGNDNPWFRSVMNGYLRLYGTELTADSFKKMSPIQFAQELLGKPFEKSLRQLIEETQKQGESEDD